tara:strand:- start:106 stop:471 length:366 start_codon:yes stop_codon:yes gene_type:complete
LIIKKIDINSILPIIIKIIKLIFELVNKLEKFKFSILNNSELTVFVKVRIDSLKDFSNPMLSNTKKLDKMNKLKKKEIKIRKEILTLSSVIFLSDAKIVLFIILFGLINFIISEEEIFKRM